MFNIWISDHLDFLQHLPFIFSVAVGLFFVIGWCYGKFLLRTGGRLVIKATIASAIFGLSALVLGFTFSSAASHFDSRVNNIRAQAFTLNKVYQSVRSLNLVGQAALQQSLRDLLNLRLATFKNLKSLDELEERLQRWSDKLEEIDAAISTEAVNASAKDQALIDRYLRPQFNNLVDSFNTGALIAKNHPPLIIVEFLFIMLCVSALLGGCAMAVEKEEDWLLTAIYLILMAYALFVIFSLEFPNQLFDYDTLNRELLQLQNKMSLNSGVTK